MGYSHGKQWSENEIVKTLKRMVETLGMNTMPTHSEMNNFFGTASVSNAVSKRGGSKHYANLLGLPIKQCESKFGDKIEDYCVLQIEDILGLSCEKTKPRYPYDILVDRSVKIDVKASRLFNNYGKSRYYTFNMEKKDQTCDIFVFYCINDMDEVERTLVIPSYVLSGKTQLALGIKSMYDKYENKWEYIKKYNEFISNCV